MMKSGIPGLDQYIMLFQEVATFEPGTAPFHMNLHERLEKYKVFFDLCSIGSVGVDIYLTKSSLAISCSLQSALVMVVRLTNTDWL